MSTIAADIKGIAKAISEDVGLNFDAMVLEGIKHIETLGGKSWTNYNPSDPGVVLLENLCFALLDLGYKSTFPMKDLLTNDQQKIQTHNKLYKPRQILFTNPVTVKDYRKLLIDRVEAIKNVWINVVKPDGGFNGVYEVHFELDDAFKVEWLNLLETEPHLEIVNTQEQKDWQERKKALKQGVKEVRNGMEALLLQHRNLGEFFFRPNMLVPKAATLEGAIYLEKEADVEKTMAWIYYQLNNYLSEFITFSTYDQLKDEGMTAGEIMSGPKMSRGYIKGDELQARKTEADPQVMKATLMSNQSIMSLYGFKVDFTGKKTADGQNSGLEKFNLNKHESLFFDYTQIVEQLNATGTKLMVYHGEKQVTQLDQNRISTYYEQYTNQNAVLSTEMEDELGPEFPEGDYREVAEYFSIQNVIPSSFGLTLDQTQDGYTTERLGQIKQLKAFVMLFEQVVADHQLQMSMLPQLLSFDSGVKVGEPLCQTLFGQGLYNVPGAQWILKAYEGYEVDSDYMDWYPHKNWDRFTNDPFNAYQAFLDNQKAHEAHNINHKSEVLTHLYARLGGKYQETSLLELNPKYDNYKLAQVENVSGLLKHFWLYSGNLGRSYFRPEFGHEPSGNHPRNFEKKFHLLFTGLEYKFGLTFQLNAYYKGIIDIVTNGFKNKDPYLVVKEETEKLLKGGDQKVYAVYYYDKKILNIPIPEGDHSQELVILEHIHLLKLMCRQTRGFVLIDNLLLIKQLENQAWKIKKGDKTLPLIPSGAKSSKKLQTRSHNLRQVQAVLNKFAKKLKGKDVVLETELAYQPITSANGQSNSEIMQQVVVRSDDTLYDFAVSIMIPNWVTALDTPSFRKTFRSAFAEEGPLHLEFNIYRLDYDDMDQLMAIRRLWMGLVKKQQQGRKTEPEELDYVGNMVAFLQNLNKDAS